MESAVIPMRKTSLPIWQNNVLGKQRWKESNKPTRISNSTLWRFFCFWSVKMLPWKQRCKNSTMSSLMFFFHNHVPPWLLHLIMMVKILTRVTRGRKISPCCKTNLPKSCKPAVRILKCQIIWRLIRCSLHSSPFVPFLFVPPHISNLRTSKSLK